VTDGLDKVRLAVAAEHGLNARAAKFLVGEDLETLERSAASLAALLGREREPEPELGFFERAQLEKARRKHELAMILTGRAPRRDPQGRFSFDGGARRLSPPEPESHEQTLSRILRSREADAGGRF
jgi:hypothetical protein